MGFDFSRIEYDVPNDVVRIDGRVARGWEFIRFELQNTLRSGSVEDYVGVTARFVGEEVAPECKVRAEASPAWLRVFDAKEFLTATLVKLSV